MFAKSTEYALRAVVFLANNTNKSKRFAKKEIAEQLGFPEPYLAKILQHLVKSGIINSIKGPNGGFFATEKTMDFSLLDIIEANEGLSFFTQCGMGLVECNHEKPCPIHNDYDKIRKEYYNTLSKKKIKNIINDLEDGSVYLQFTP